MSVFFLSCFLKIKFSLHSMWRKMAVCIGLILVEIDTLWNLSIFPPPPKTFIVILLNAGLQHISWLLVSLLLGVNPKRKKLTTTSVSSLSIPRLLSLVSFYLYLNLVSCFHCAPWPSLLEFPDCLHYHFSEVLSDSTGHWCFISNFSAFSLQHPSSIYSEYKLTK